MAINQIYTSSAQTPTGGGTAITVDAALTLETRNVMKGTVLEDDDTTPIVGAAVELLEITASPAGQVVKARVYTRSDGTYGIPFLPVSGKTYKVDIFAPNPVV
ncbi:MAG: hypothetical protein ACRC1P_04440 [Cellulosilyticaceae bacterium]